MIKLILVILRAYIVDLTITYKILIIMLRILLFSYFGGPTEDELQYVILQSLLAAQHADS
jgi:hypothetical protein